MKLFFRSVVLSCSCLFFSGLFGQILPVSASETTLYFNSWEKTMETGRKILNLPLGGTTAVKTISSSGNATVTYLHLDNLGSTVFVNDISGLKLASPVYYPFGKEMNILNQVTDYFYTGQRLDFSTDLYYYNARYYNPRIGHFVSADKAEGGNRYAYVGNNPIMKNDPSGNESFIPPGFFDHVFDPQANLQLLKNIIDFPTDMADSIINNVKGGAVKTYEGIGTGNIENIINGPLQMMNGIAMGMFFAAPGRVSATRPAVQQAKIAGAASTVSEEYLTVFRGTDNPEVVQTAGGLRSGKFTLDELLTTPQSELIRQVWPGKSDLTNYYAELEKQYPQESVKAYNLAQSGMDISPYLSTSLKRDVAAGFGDYVIEARVPKSATVNIDLLSNPIYGFKSGKMSAEAEIGIIGMLRPEWIRSVTQVK